ncbi:hypothetical protein L6164_020018 [Bauhinia variegata]|uniref:Uncharacterized protein n=1 Tax=Bauhinia variegata TaxID=167791 RepID=A0ACB9MU67_BAUVA|nr:hypothetical protein L6164_020018 [Bauhinia variegata]
MAKRFKFRISRVLSSFRTCRSKDPSTLPSNPAPSFPKLINFHFPPAGSLSSKHQHSSLGRHVSSALISVGCGFRSTATLSDDDFRWEQEDKWHVVAKVYDETPRRKIYNSSVSGGSDTEDDDLLPLPPPSRLSKMKRHVKKKKTTRRTVRISTSSADSCGLFSSDGYDERDVDEEETATLVSPSRSFSTESSSEFNPHLEPICETSSNEGKKMKQKQKKRIKNKKKKSRRSVSMRKKSISSPQNGSPARLSMFQRLIPCRVEGKMRESFAVVKRSEDPYEDFRMSMMEMVVEKQMFEKKDLEQLLHCFLSLNSSRHHGIIIEAFTEIWEALFCTRPTKLS